MAAFAKIEVAPEPRSDTSKKIAWFLVGILLVMALTQLVGFEKFIPLIETYDLSGGESTAIIVASLIVISEVFALPFLLRMPLSKLMRLLSMICAVIAPLTWLCLTLWGVLSSAPISNLGMFGSYVSIPVGWAAVFMSGAIAVLAAWSVWGLWPFETGSKTSEKIEK